jgi:MoaA/NifB/PqqE/SkfB family radical SAM enzyme
MFKIEDIRHLHMEFSSLCNARCPLCPRNLYGYPYNNGYAETNLGFDLIRNRFSPSFISQLRGMLVNGNFGDFLLNPESDKILSYFREHNPKMNILISTNGSARNPDFWKKLGSLKLVVEFCLDGLEDTHYLYRQDTDWQKIVDNAKIYMEAGGSAIWKMIKFAHNEHQIEKCKSMAADLGFDRFVMTDHGRNNGPVFNRDGTRSHSIGKGEPNFDNVEQAVNWSENSSTINYPNFDTSVEPVCEVKKNSSIYIAADGRVYPCCWLGMNPHTYHKGFLGLVNKYTMLYMKKNDLHDHSLEECLEWFWDVERSWRLASYKEGRLLQCDMNCNSCRKTENLRNEQVL